MVFLRERGSFQEMKPSYRRAPHPECSPEAPWISQVLGRGLGSHFASGRLRKQTGLRFLPPPPPPPSLAESLGPREVWGRRAWAVGCQEERALGCGTRSQLSFHMTSSLSSSSLGPDSSFLQVVPFAFLSPGSLLKSSPDGPCITSQPPRGLQATSECPSWMGP